jgi:hypothetical protein
VFGSDYAKMALCQKKRRHQNRAFAGIQMAIEIGKVQAVSMRSGDHGWGFTLTDTAKRPSQFFTIAYRTEAEAKDAREKIAAATANAI